MMIRRVIILGIGEMDMGEDVKRPPRVQPERVEELMEDRRRTKPIRDLIYDPGRSASNDSGEAVTARR